MTEALRIPQKMVDEIRTLFAPVMDYDARVAELKEAGEIVIVDEKEGGKNANSKNP